MRVLGGGEGERSGGFAARILPIVHTGYVKYKISIQV